MKPYPSFNDDFLDILFLNRNKLYGSYQLRRGYASRMEKALGIVFGSVLILLLYFVLRPDANIVESVGGIIYCPTELTDLTETVRPPIPKPKTKAVPEPLLKSKTKTFTPPVLTDEPFDEDKVMTDLASMKDANAGAANEGDSLYVGQPDGDIADKGRDVTPVQPSTLPVDYAEVMPMFDGNIQEWLSRNIRYPDAAREAGIQGRVGLRFVVNEDGSISGVNVIRSIGGGCDEEAARVIATMPRWKPGRQNGRAVKVYFRLAVNFKLQ